MCLNPIPINIGTEHFKNYIRVPCGKCTECQENYSREWAFRCVQEASFYSESCFVTLTYADNPVMLIKKDFQDFLKRLRERIFPIKIRYFLSGEYGSHTLRPHGHIMIFGWKPHDLIEYGKDKRGNMLYLSPFIADVWKGHKDPVTGLYPNPRAGFCSVGDITISSAKYCAKYMQKFQELPENFVKPFTLMSRKPGLGFNAICVTDLNTDSIIINGERIQVPRYYLKKLEEEGIDLSILKSNRVYMGQARQSFLGEEKRKKKSIDFIGS